MENTLTINELFVDAGLRKASDLHITAGASPKCRVNGELIDMGYNSLSPQDTEKLIIPIVPVWLKDKLQESGEADLAYSIPDIGRYRVNVFKQKGSYAMVGRIINTVIPSPQSLGLPSSVIALTKKKRGMILVTGPTGSGKSTTLASLINLINENAHLHIVTLEDPIEYIHSHKKSIVNQREIGIDTLSFANALRVVLREDPDVILVGEMRDLETIEIAITAAETGHLVLSTLHTIGAANTVDRMIDVFPPHQQQQIRVQLSTVLEAVVSQQLIPTKDQKGRAACFEIMHSTPAIRNLIREGKSHQLTSFIQTNKSLGMQTMDDAIYSLYFQGIISSEQALAFAQDAGFMERKLL